MFCSIIYILLLTYNEGYTFNNVSFCSVLHKETKSMLENVKIIGY